MKYLAAICLLLATVFASALHAQSGGHGPPGCDGDPPYGVGPPGDGGPRGNGPPEGAGPPDCLDPPGNGDPSDGDGPPNGFGPPEFAGMHIPDHAGPPSFVTLLHCGCDAEAEAMEFVEITVTSRSRGHLNHIVGSIDSCAPEDSDIHLDFVRTMADCQIDGEQLLGDSIAECTDQSAGQACGELAPPPSGG